MGMMSQQPPASGRTVKSADRTIEILELLAAHQDRLTLSELQRGLGVPKSSLHGLLRTLCTRGWLDTDPRGTSYGIGLRALRTGVAYLERDPTVQAVGPILTRVRDEIDETVHLARLDGGDIVYLASRESMHHLRSSSRIGRRLPAYATALGKALLAERPPADVDAMLPDPLIPLTPETVVDPEQLRADLAEIRLRGWSMERGQSVMGLGCIAVAVRTRSPAVDALSCSIPLVRFSDEHTRDVVAALARAADDLAGLVGRAV
jgi:DNA-binding IclR family transcriptional regulator